MDSTGGCAGSRTGSGDAPSRPSRPASARETTSAVNAASSQIAASLDLPFYIPSARPARRIPNSDLGIRRTLENARLKGPCQKKLRQGHRRTAPDLAACPARCRLGSGAQRPNRLSALFWGRHCPRGDGEIRRGHGDARAVDAGTVPLNVTDNAMRTEGHALGRDLVRAQRPEAGCGAADPHASGANGALPTDSTPAAGFAAFPFEEFNLGDLCLPQYRQQNPASHFLSFRNREHPARVFFQNHVIAPHVSLNVPSSIREPNQFFRRRSRKFGHCRACTRLR